MNNKIIYLSVVIAVFNGCTLTKEKNTLTNTVIKNPLPYFVKVNYYTNGLKKDSLALPVLSQKIVSSLDNRGKGSGLTYPNIVISFYDSAVISFNDTYTVTHYSKNTSASNPTALLFINQRNIFNQDNYQRTILNESKTFIQNEYIFEFTEQDYIYARDK